MENAKVIRESLTDIGLEVYGGVSSPYIWVKTPNDMDSWDFFDILLNDANVVGTPGSGFKTYSIQYIGKYQRSNGQNFKIRILGVGIENNRKRDNY